MASAECGGFRVAPGDPGSSYLVHKITGVGICSGVRMPFGQPPLAQGDIDTIVSWICGGAMDN